MLSFFGVIGGLSVVLFLLFWTIISTVSVGDLRRLKRCRMKLMGHCCANCDRYNKKTNCCTITSPAKRCWHEITGWYNIEETTSTRCAYYVVGSDNCHWKRKVKDEQ